MNEVRAAVAAELARLRVDYLARLPTELETLTDLASRLSEGDIDRPVLEDLRHRLHKLAGSGGSFGLKDLSELARSLERTIDRWLETWPDKVDAGSRRGFAAGVAALSAVLIDALPEEPPPAANDSSAADPSAPLRILLVLADPAEGASFEGHLAQFGYEVRSLSRFDNIQAAFADHPKPDLLICDAEFPTEGIDATRQLDHSNTLGCPVLFIGTSDSFALRARAARQGAAGFLVRPLDIVVLAEHIEKLFTVRNEQPYRVLIIDDDTSLADHYRLLLSMANIETQVLDRPENTLERIAAFRPEMLLLDLNMPEYSGVEIATVIRQYDEWVGLPIVFLSAETNLDKQIAALGQGADDFLVKPISDAHLVAAVRVRAARFRQLASLVAKDSLTGLLRHARIKEEIDIALSRVRRTNTPMNVAMIDIDHFKSVNDTYGHAVGDRVIKAVAQLLRQRLRKSDSIGRYGGEEFVALLPDCDAATAQGIIDDIRQRFAALRFRQGELEFSCTLSAGVACSLEHPDSAGSDLLIAADEALYAAKHGGRNQVRLAGR